MVDAFLKDRLTITYFDDILDFDRVENGTGKPSDMPKARRPRAAVGPSKRQPA